MFRSKMTATFFVVVALFVTVPSPAQTAVGGNLLVNNPALDTVAAALHTQEETSIAVNPTTGTICVLYNDTYDYTQGTGGLGVSRSTNGGVSFNDLGALGAIPGGDKAQSDPSVVFRQSDGTFYATAITFGFSVGLWASTDDCSSFGFITYIDVQGDTAPGDDKDMMTVDNNPTSAHYGRLYVAFLDHALSTNPAESLQVLSFSDNTTTWSTPLVLSGAGVDSRGSWPTVGPNGDVYVAWDVLGTNFTFDVDVVRSVNGGASFSAVTNPVTGAITPYNATATAGCSLPPNVGALNGRIQYAPFPQLAVGPDRCLHLTYSIGPNTSHTGDTVDVYYRRSCTYGTTWQGPVKINDDGTATDQFLPNLSVSPANVVSVSFYDRRNDPTNNLAYDIYMRESVDGGTTFKPSVRVTTSSNPTYIEPRLGCSFADYDQQAQVPGAIYLLWTDNRSTFNGNPDTNVGFQKMNAGTGGVVWAGSGFQYDNGASAFVPSVAMTYSASFGSYYQTEVHEGNSQKVGPPPDLSDMGGAYTTFTSPNKYATGLYPAIASNGINGLLFEVHQASSAQNSILWYSMGQQNGPTLNLGNLTSLGQVGFFPTVAIARDDLWIVEAHQTQQTQGPLYMNVALGFSSWQSTEPWAGMQYNWGAKPSISAWPTRPAISPFNSDILIMEVHQGGDSNNLLWSDFGILHINGDGTWSMNWVATSQYTGGRMPSVAICNNHDVVAVNEGGNGSLWSHQGIITVDSQENYSFQWMPGTDQWYDNGYAPKISCTSPKSGLDVQAQGLEVHEGATGATWAHAFTVNP